MDRDYGIGLHVDPLGDLEVQRALALARARENYPAVPRETLLGYCEAAWDVALQADPRGRDLQGSFDRALLIIAWTQRRSGGRVPLSELIDQTVPRIALEPFIAEPRSPEVGVQPEETVPSRRSPLRLPFSSPIPVGAAIAAAGVVGVGVLSQAEVIPIAPLQPADSDDAGGGDEVATRDAGERGSKRAAGDAAQYSGDVVAGLAPSGAGGAAGQAFAAPAAPSAGSPGPAAPTAKASRTDGAAPAGRAEEAADAQVAAQTAGAQAAPPAPEAPAAPAPPPPPQPVVRVEMTHAPTAMILEVSTPQRPVTRDDEDAATPDVDADVESPADPVGDEGEEPQDDRRSARDEDEEDRGPLDVLEDLMRDRDDEDGDGDEAAPEQLEPSTPPIAEEPIAEEPPAPVPATPDEAAPAPVPAPSAAPAPSAPAPAPAPAETAPAPAEPAPVEPAPAAPAPAPAAPATPAPTTPPAPPA